MLRGQGRWPRPSPGSLGPRASDRIAPAARAARTRHPPARVRPGVSPPPVSLDANRPMRYEPRTMRLPRLSRPLLLPVVLATVLAALVPHLARAAGDPHGVDMLPILEALVLMLIGAKLGGDLFERIGQPAVLGELLAG